MIGGPPIMSQPVYPPSVPSYPPASYPVMPQTVAPGSWSGPAALVISAPPSANGMRAASAAPFPGGVAVAPQGGASNLPRPTFRAKGPDEPALAGPLPTTTVALSIPTPEQLGVALAPAEGQTGLDWAAAHRRLEKLGAVCLHMDKLETGACRFTCILPTNQPGITHRVEAEAANAGEAATLVLSQAEQWANPRPNGSK